jgi:hypothetical protein
LTPPSPTVRTAARACIAICVRGGRFREHSPARLACLRGGTSKRRSPRRTVIWIFETTERPLSWTLGRAVWTPLRGVRIHNRSTRWQKQRRLPFASAAVSAVGGFSSRSLCVGPRLVTDELHRHFRSVCTNTPFLASLVCYMTCPSQYPTLVKRSGEDEIRLFCNL